MALSCSSMAIPCSFIALSCSSMAIPYSFIAISCSFLAFSNSTCACKASASYCLASSSDSVPCCWAFWASAFAVSAFTFAASASTFAISAALCASCAAISACRISSPSDSLALVRPFRYAISTLFSFSAVLAVVAFVLEQAKEKVSMIIIHTDRKVFSTVFSDLLLSWMMRFALAKSWFLFFPKPNANSFCFILYS